MGMTVMLGLRSPGLGRVRRVLRFVIDQQIYISDYLHNVKGPVFFLSYAPSIYGIDYALSFLS